MTKPILILNGPNLNMLGTRQPEIYGTATLSEMVALCNATAQELGLSIDCRHSNLEGELVTWIQESRQAHAGIIINAGGYSHTSVAIHDALMIAELPVIEVHTTNTQAREEFRHHSLVAQAAKGVISGLGIEGYALALRAMRGLIDAPKSEIRKR